MNGGRIVAALVVLVIAISTTVWAEETASAEKAKAADPTGTWKWEYSFNDDPAEFMLKLNWDGKQLTGKYTAFGNTTDIEEAKFEDGQLSFISNRQFNGNEFTVEFDGELQQNDIEGTVAVDFGDGAREFDWHATRAADFDAILGKWKLKLDTPQGVIEPELTITQEDGQLKGHYVSPFGEREAKDLAFEDGELSWRIEADDDDEFDFEVVYRGKPDGDKITGSNEYDFGGNTGTMEFTGQRTPPEDDAKPAATTNDAAPADKPSAATQAETATPAESATE
jgi:hypothetical protein